MVASTGVVLERMRLVHILGSAWMRMLKWMPVLWWMGVFGGDGMDSDTRADADADAEAGVDGMQVLGAAGVDAGSLVDADLDPLKHRMQRVKCFKRCGPGSSGFRGVKCWAIMLSPRAWLSIVKLHRMRVSGVFGGGIGEGSGTQPGLYQALASSPTKSRGNGQNGLLN